VARLVLGDSPLGYAGPAIGLIENFHRRRDVTARLAVFRVARYLHDCVNLGPRLARRRQHIGSGQVQECTFPRVEILRGDCLPVAMKVEEVQVDVASCDTLIFVWLPDGAQTYGLAGDDSERSECSRLPR